jgi:hypothetical protein
MFDNDKLNVQSNAKQAEDGKSVCCSHNPSMWPRATWAPETLKNQAGEKTRKIKLTLSTGEPGNENGKTLTKEFKIFRTGSPEEWILWHRDFNKICTGMAMTAGSNRNRMVCQLLSDKSLSQFDTRLATYATETNANCTLALDAVAVQIFPKDAHAKQKKYLRQGMWKPRALTIRNVCVRLCELNNQLTSYPNQTGVLPENELKSAFINMCLPEWQQEFSKVDINEHASTWEEKISKAEALETAELALAERAPAKRNIKEGEITAPTSKLPPKKKAKKEEKSPFYCKLHGSGQGHNTIGCGVINGQIDNLKAVREGRQPCSQNSGINNQQSKSNWTNGKRPPTSCSTKQLKDIVCMTKKKVMKNAKEKFQSQLHDNLNAIEHNDSAAKDQTKMHEMESFMNNLIDNDESELEDIELTQAELDELTALVSS